ncbi:hypothetical protein JMM61_03705 [Rhodovulum sulfidophilum]|nr:hypothetical protein [Rhodovulum sulfidophilum]
MVRSGHGLGAGPHRQAQRRLQREQDGSEVKSLELERLVAEGQSMVERRTALELFRDLAAEGFEHHLGKALWKNQTSRRKVTDLATLHMATPSITPNTPSMCRPSMKLQS